jgi:hypothetical protein
MVKKNDRTLIKKLLTDSLTGGGRAVWLEQ